MNPEFYAEVRSIRLANIALLLDRLRTNERDSRVVRQMAAEISEQANSLRRLAEEESADLAKAGLRYSIANIPDGTPTGYQVHRITRTW